MNNKDFWAGKIRSAMKAVDAGAPEAGLARAPNLTYWRPHISRRWAPILWGMVSGHPKLSDGWITTSQLVAIDPDFRWARTASRWYALGQPFSEYEAMIARGLKFEGAPAGFVQIDVPGFRPLDDMSRLDELLAVWRVRMLSENEDGN